jgi:tripartite-type tricarboxylate transporter receptor subunit TctC
LLESTAYDPLRDFLPIAMLASSPQVLVVHPALSAKSVKELIALAKSTPGKLNYASANAGSSSHLPAELFKSMAGVDIVRVAYKTTAGALTGGIAGETQLQFTSGSSVTPHIKSGRLRALAVTSAEPSQLFPGLPTVAATLPGFEAITSQGTFAPARTPAAVVNRLNQEIVRAMNKPEVKDQLFSAGSEVVASSTGQLAAAMKSEMASMGKVIKDVGIRAD